MGCRMPRPLNWVAPTRCKRRRAALFPPGRLREHIRTELHKKMLGPLVKHVRTIEVTSFGCPSLPFTTGQKTVPQQQDNRISGDNGLNQVKIHLSPLAQSAGHGSFSPNLGLVVRLFKDVRITRTLLASEHGRASKGALRHTS